MTRKQRVSNPWFQLGWQSWMLGIEASSVITARLMKLAAGGDQAEREFRLMIDEKTAAGHELQTKLSRLGVEATPEAAMALALRHYRQKVAFNKRRLSR